MSSLSSKTSLATQNRRNPLNNDPSLLRTILDSLTITRYFGQASRSLLETVLQEGLVIQLEAGEFLIRQGNDDINAMYFLLSGKLDVYSGGNYIVSLTEVGEVIGELAAITDLPRTADVLAKEHCSLVEIPKSSIENLRTHDTGRYLQLLELITLYLGGKLTLTTRRVHAYEDLVMEKEQLRTHSEKMGKIVEEKLRQIVLYSHIIQSTQDGVVIATPAGKIISANPAAKGLFGWTADELPDQSLFEIIPSFGSNQLASETAMDSEFKEECELPKTVHGPMPVEVTFTPIRQENQVKASATFIRDMRRYQKLLASLEKSRNELAQHSNQLEDMVAARTQELRQANHMLTDSNAQLQRETEEKSIAYERLKETQNKLLESEKMSALGHLAAGVAHEINNPIGFVFSNLNSLGEYFENFQQLTNIYGELERRSVFSAVELSQLGDRIRSQKKAMDFDFVSDDWPAIISSSLEGIARVMEIVKSLKGFTSDAQQEKTKANLNQCIETTLGLIGNELRLKARVEKHFGEIPDIKCYPQQLNQVILALLVNASQSVDKDGTIRITTEAIGNDVVVNISDNGCGIAPENIPRIFDPFFTTRPLGKGPGLGLSSVYSIVKQHDGTMDVASELNKGTTFTLRFPVQAKDTSKEYQ